MTDTAQHRPPAGPARATTGPTPAGARGTGAPPASHDVGLLARLWPFLRPHGWLLGLALALVPLTSLAALVQPYLIKQAIDAAIVAKSHTRLADVVMLLVAAIGAELVTRFVQMCTLQLGGQRTVADIRRAAFTHTQRLSMGYLDRTPLGRVLTRITNDTDSLGELFSSGAVLAVADLTMLVGIVGFMLYLDWRLSLFALATLPPLALFVAALRKRARQAFRAIRQRVSELNAFLSEQVQGVSTVQAFAQEQACARDYARINAAHRDANFAAIRLDAVLFSVVEAVSASCIAIVLWYAAVRAGALPDTKAAAAYVGTVVAFYEYIQRFFVPLRDLSTKYTIIQASLAAAERIFELLDLDEVEPQPTGPQLRAAEDRDGLVPWSADGNVPAVRFDHVTFGYNANTWALRDVSFEVRPCERVAIVGPTGAGKSTVLSLVLGLYRAQRGNVEVLGDDLRHVDPRVLRNRIAVVPQDVFLFAGTLLDNIALGAPDPDPERARTALEQLGADDLLARRAGGLQARVEERGANFSAGERQLLAFARALYRDAPLLLLDEATAQVDSDTEARIQDALGALLQRRAAIVVAHRLSTIERADRILVLKHGQLIEQGPHRQLLDEQGVYAALHALHYQRERLATG